MIYLLSLRKCLRISIFLLMMLVSVTAKNQKMNVLLIICDDLNDYIEGFGGHPQARTPNIKRLMESGISFLDAHCNIPICNPSRASMMTGLYPHTAGPTVNKIPLKEDVKTIAEIIDEAGTPRGVFNLVNG